MYQKQVPGTREEGGLELADHMPEKLLNQAWYA